MIEGISLIILGTALILAFVYLNYVLEPRRFQLRPVEEPHLSFSESIRDRHTLMGVLEAALFFLGITVFTAGCLMIGTLHPSA